MLKVFKFFQIIPIFQIAAEFSNCPQDILTELQKYQWHSKILSAIENFPQRFRIFRRNHRFIIEIEILFIFQRNLQDKNTGTHWNSGTLQHCSGRCYLFTFETRMVWTIFGGKWYASMASSAFRIWSNLEGYYEQSMFQECRIPTPQYWC